MQETRDDEKKKKKLFQMRFSRNKGDDICNSESGIGLRAKYTCDMYVVCKEHSV